MIDAATRIWAERLTECSGLRTGQSFLDVGGADGSLCHAIEDLSGARGTILDPGVNEESESSVRGAADAMPFDDGRFDVVIVKHAAHLFSKPVVAMREAFRVLKRDGILIICTSSHGDLRRQPLASWNPELFEGLLDNVRDLDRVCLWIARAGFSRPVPHFVRTPFLGSYEQWIAGMVYIAENAWMRTGCIGSPPGESFVAFLRSNFTIAAEFHETLLVARRP